MNDLFEAMHVASRAEIETPLAVRKDRLNRLERLLIENEQAFVDAINADFGSRPSVETKLAEIMPLLMLLRFSRNRVRRWMRPKRRGVHWAYIPSVGRVEPQPLGVIGIMSPWNYPLFLSIGPLIDALAAGNRVLIKPSELTPKTSELMQKLFSERFAEDEVAVVTGDVETSIAFSKLPFDHLVFTGSTAIGREVAAAAARNLTPVTLELGGKSPVIVADDYPLKKAASQIAYGRMLNAGQTCVSIEYVLAPKDKVEELSKLINAALAKKLPDLDGTFSSIVSDKYYERQQDMLAEVEGQSEILVYGEDNPEARKLAPRIVLNPPLNSKLVNEEVFGPILFVQGYDSLDHAIEFVNSKPRPLSLYCFTNKRSVRRKVLGNTVSGNANVNGVIAHIIQPNLPFGGVGDSGYGGYHGYDGFLRFSHNKAVHYLSRFDPLLLIGPPWGLLSDFVYRLIRR